jgi:hypothetical protein
MLEGRCHNVLSIRAQQATATQKAEAVFDALLAKTFKESCGVRHGAE